jgi:hypothetical protein
MSSFKRFLFTDDSPKLVLDLDEKAFGASYGNRRANGKKFREPWTRRDRKIASAASVAADACGAAGCS